MMKQSLAILALAALIAWPAAGEAASKKKKVRHKAAPIVQQRHAPPWYGQAKRRPHSPNPAWDVYYTDGTYAGSDPDPRIRMMLQKDDARYIGME